MSRDSLIAILFGVAFIVAGALTFTGKATAVESFGPVLTGFVGWIAAQLKFAASLVSKNESKLPGVLLVVGAASVASAGSACTPQARRDVANTLLDVIDIACVLYQSEAGKPETEVMRACRINDTVAPQVQKIIAAQKKASAMRDVSKDAGTGAQ